MTEFQIKIVAEYKTCRKVGLSHFRAIQQTAAANITTSKAVRAALALAEPFTAADWMER